VRELTKINPEPSFLRECWAVMNAIKAEGNDKHEIASSGQIRAFLEDLESTAQCLLNLLKRKDSPDYVVPTAAEEFLPNRYRELIQELRQQLPGLLQAISERQLQEPETLELSRYHIKHMLAVIELEQVFKRYNLPLKGRGAMLLRYLEILFKEAGYGLDSPSLRKLVWKAHQPITLKSGKTARLFVRSGQI